MMALTVLLALLAALSNASASVLRRLVAVQEQPCGCPRGCVGPRPGSTGGSPPASGERS
ncbi:hypothetical protein [Streptomyces sp. NPDC047841]|uniref:hypothetical protein n=1 Tax=Streptomyces sp. NPDC047841 TaxID=3154708 RepID=UPI0034561FC2